MRLLIFILILQSFFAQPLFAQKEIVRNGKKINRLDKQNRKQDRWFFFNQAGDVLLSCDYKNDSIISPVIYYAGSDTGFIRYPKINNTEIFILYIDGAKVIGNNIFLKDTSEIEIIGTYRQVTKDSFDIREDLAIQHSPAVMHSAQKWLSKTIYPLYMFGNGFLKDFLYGGFHGSDFTFNKPIYAEITIDGSGIVKKVEFPPEKKYSFLCRRNRDRPYFFRHAEMATIFFRRQNTKGEDRLSI
jgi:hypothetical protein